MAEKVLLVFGNYPYRIMTGTPTMVWGDFVTCLVQTGQPFKFSFEDLKTNCTYLVYKFRLTSAATSLVTGGEIWVKMAVWSTSLSSGISIKGTSSPSWTFLNRRRWSGWPLLMVLLPADIETFYAVEARIGWDCSSEEVEWQGVYLPPLHATANGTEGNFWH